MNKSEIAALVKESVTALQAAEALGLEPDRNGKCRCPFHGDAKPSMKLYDGRRGFYCFACHKGGDVIDLTQQTLGSTFTDALKWLCETFGIWTDNNTSNSAGRAREATEAAKRRAEAHAIEQRRRDMDYEMYLIAGEVVRDLEEQVETYRPQRPGDVPDTRFVEALNLLPGARENLTRLAMMVTRSGAM